MGSCRHSRVTKIIHRMGIYSRPDATIICPPHQSGARNPDKSILFAFAAISTGAKQRYLPLMEDYWL